VFDPVAKRTGRARQEEFFYCTSSGAKGKGLYTQEGFVVLKGSIGRRENVPSIIGTPGERLRQKLLDSGIMRPEGDLVVFERDHLRIPAKVATRSEGKWPLVLIQSGPSVRRKAAGDSGQSGQSDVAPRHGMGVVTRGRGRLSTRWCVCALSPRSN